MVIIIKGCIILVVKISVMPRWLSFSKICFSHLMSESFRLVEISRFILMYKISIIKVRSMVWWLTILDGFDMPEFTGFDPWTYLSLVRVLA